MTDKIWVVEARDAKWELFEMFENEANAKICANNSQPEFSYYEYRVRAYLPADAVQEALKAARAALLISESAYEMDNGEKAKCAVCGGNPHALTCEVYNALALIEPWIEEDK